MMVALLKSAWGWLCTSIQGVLRLCCPHSSRSDPHQPQPQQQQQLRPQPQPPPSPHFPIVWRLVPSLLQHDVEFARKNVHLVIDQEIALEAIPAIRNDRQVWENTLDQVVSSSLSELLAINLKSVIELAPRHILADRRLMMMLCSRRVIHFHGYAAVRMIDVALLADSNFLDHLLGEASISIPVMIASVTSCMACTMTLRRGW